MTIQISERLRALVQHRGAGVLRKPYRSFDDPVWLAAFGQPGARPLYDLSPEDKAEILALHERYTPDQIAELAASVSDGSGAP